MREFVVALLIFVCLVGASLGTLLIYDKLPQHHREDDTHNVVRLVANIFVVLTSLVLGLMINSAKNTFEAVDHNVHTIATDLILLDRTLRQIGPDASDARQRVLAYTDRAANSSRHQDPLIADRVSEGLLNDIGTSLRAIKPQQAERAALLKDTEQQFIKILQQRWIIVEQSEGTIPTPLLVMMVAWLMLIFASFGYRAPKNAIVVTSFVVSSALIAGALYLILDMDLPFTGPIQISSTPLQRAIAEMQR